MEPKKVENHTSLTLKKAKNLKRKQTPPRHLVVTYKNVHKIKKWVFDQFYHPSKNEPCRSSQNEMRAFCRCRQKGVKKAEIKAEINRSALAGEPDPLERWLMALWVPLGLRKLGKGDFIFACGRSSSILPWPPS